MDLKRGVLIALALYAVTLAIGIIITLVARNSLASPQEIPTTYWLITIITTVILTSLAALWYFTKAKRNAKEGLNLGITFVIVGFILDIIFFLTQSNGTQIIKEYYSSLSFYIVLILVVATCVYIGSRNPSSKIEEIKPKTKRKRK